MEDISVWIERTFVEKYKYSFINYIHIMGLVNEKRMAPSPGEIKDALQFMEEIYIGSDQLKTRFHLNESKEYHNVVNYLTNNRYLVRVFRGFFYIPTLKERKYGINADIMEAIAMGMEHRDVKNWYFGYNTALKLNNLTHEYFTSIDLVTDTIRKKQMIKVMDNQIKFLFIKPELFRFGLIRKGRIRFSDPEKTSLDIIYLMKKRGKKEEQIMGKLAEIIPQLEKSRIEEYVGYYPTTVGKFIGGF